MKDMIVKEVMKGDVSPVAMFGDTAAFSRSYDFEVFHHIGSVTFAKTIVVASFLACLLFTIQFLFKSLKSH